jgi:hypothetical protein
LAMASRWAPKSGPRERLWHFPRAKNMRNTAILSAR